MDHHPTEYQEAHSARVGPNRKVAPFSPVWEFFNRLAEERKARCRCCDTHLSIKSRSTESLWHHLKSFHPAEHKIAQHKRQHPPNNTTDASGESSKTVAILYKTFCFDVWVMKFYATLLRLLISVFLYMLLKFVKNGYFELYLRNKVSSRFIARNTQISIEWRRCTKRSARWRKRGNWDNIKLPPRRRWNGADCNYSKKIITL